MQQHVAIIGGSLTGLAAANALNRLGLSVSVFEKFPATFEKRGSSLGYVDVPLWESIRGAPMMRFGKRANRSQGAYYYGDLWQYLYDGLPKDIVNFNQTITDLGNDALRPTINGVTYDAVIIADGGWSSLRHYVNGSKEPEYAGYFIWRLKVALEHIPGFYGEGAYNSGKYFIIALNVPTCDGQKYVMGGLAIETPESEAVRPVIGASRHTEIAPDTAVPDWFLPFVRQTFGRQAGGEVLRWVEACASKGKITPQPLFEFMAEKVVSGRIILMGDAAHMASPRTAAGAHTGILDVAALAEAFSQHRNRDRGTIDIDAAIRAYEPGGKLRARQLYQRSKEVSRELLTVASQRQKQNDL